MVRGISSLKFPVKRISTPDDILASMSSIPSARIPVTPWPPNRHWDCLHQTGTRHYRNELTTVKFLFRQQTSRVVICRIVQTQFVDSLFPCNPVLITVTLYLDYLLFRYFQYAFHPDVFSIWRKSTEEIHTILYVLGRTLSNETRYHPDRLYYSNWKL